MLFKPRQKRYHFPMQICINEQRIEQVKETVFLGVVLDEHLSWKPHISQVARKISKSIGKPCLKTPYYCLVYPYLRYCIIVWGSTYKTNLRRLVLSLFVFCGKSNKSYKKKSYLLKSCIVMISTIWRVKESCCALVNTLFINSTSFTL